MKTETLDIANSNVPLSATSAPREEALASSYSIIQLKNILVPLDFSEMSLKSLQYAVPFAKQFGAKLTLLHVVQPPDDADLGYPVSVAAEDLAAFQRQLEQIRAANIPCELPVDILVRYGLIFDNIVEVAGEYHADLIITSTHGFTGLKHLVTGSTAETIVRRAPCPVFVVREVEQEFV